MIPVIGKRTSILQKRLLVVRYPSGEWSTGGKSDDPDHSECEKFYTWVKDFGDTERNKAKRKAQSYRSRQLKKLEDTNG